MNRVLLIFSGLFWALMAMALILWLAPSAKTVLAAGGERGILVREATLYISPDTASQKMERVGRGREVVVIDKTGEWVHVFASVDRERDITGWMLDKGVIRTSTPNGDRILFGEALDSEDQASRRHGRKGAAQDAFRLYARLAEYFPHSPLVGEALYRSADIRWQIDKDDAASRPSAKQMDPGDRAPIDDQYMREVRKKFPGTKWAALASFNMIDNKLCGDWQGLPKCPERESQIYEKYATEYPQSPKAAEALYEAAWRQSVLIEMYKASGDSRKSESAKNRSLAVARMIISLYPETSWAAKAVRLIYMLEQNIPTYGTATE